MSKEQLLEDEYGTRGIENTRQQWWSWKQSSRYEIQYMIEESRVVLSDEAISNKIEAYGKYTKGHLIIRKFVGF